MGRRFGIAESKLLCYANISTEFISHKGSSKGKSSCNSNFFFLHRETVTVVLHSTPLKLKHSCGYTLRSYKKITVHASESASGKGGGV